MSEPLPPFEWRFAYNPRFWPSWCGLGLMWLSTRLPYRLILWLGHVLGVCLWAVGRERRRITRINLRLCFPQLDRHALRRLQRQTFYSAGMAVFESALSWWRGRKEFSPLFFSQGFEHVTAALAQGKGVILLGGHYHTLEVGGRIMAQQFDNLRPTYKPARDPLFNWMMIRMRIHRNGGVINSSNMREVLRALKQNILLWYAPDQDFGSERSVFAPFMGIPAASLTFTARLARASGAPVLPWYCERLPNAQGYRVRIEPPLKNFPSGDDIADASTVNSVIELQVRRTPEQYLWGHRRFKSRPAGEPMLYKPRRDSALQRYSLILLALALPVAVYTLWLAFRSKQTQYYCERFGMARFPSLPRCIWLHAASVGEVNAIIPLITLIRQQLPAYPLLLTCNTPSGLQSARRQLSTTVAIHYLPLDWQFAVQRFIDSVQPLCGLITETEIWPNLFLYCGYRGIKLALLNARLSQRVERIPRWVRMSLCHSMNHVTTVLARSEVDKQRYISIGTAAEKIQVLGNIKFSLRPDNEPAPADLCRAYILAASTRNGEEQLIVEHYLRSQHNNTLLVIVPRHPKRLHAIVRVLNRLKLHFALRSHQDTITAATQVYVADTFGELKSFIAGAQFVIMGGSWCPFGGQNILEVANAAKAVIFGPHMNNFADEARLFVQHQAGLQLTSAQQLAATITELCANPQLAAEMGKNGLALINANRDMALRYFTVLRQRLTL
ncbi:MAG: LpxL/LpxP family Kdo(2)-lipid IV(A) lauroyl/palmitoleoyl acyltransferase [Gammaproteobacteria bacterium]|nr:LpxL/LpxP family Kdo(2)-lipid IV(A) lauroyl/palmitoleoyl acyltransferase [Gammaproteobacteria bacterium]